MKDYKRLTKRFRNSQMQPDVELLGTVSQGVYRLAELEDKIENGTLIELPCKVGDTVYVFEFYDYDTCIKECEYLYCEYGFGYECLKSHYGEKAIECVNIKEHTIKELRDIFRYWKDFGERVFLTKAEAEEKLKELKEV